jgi:hypothetical protein
LLKPPLDEAPPALKLNPPDGCAAGVVDEDAPKLNPPLLELSAGFGVLPNRLVEGAG